MWVINLIFFFYYKFYKKNNLLIKFNIKKIKQNKKMNGMELNECKKYKKGKGEKE